jgi:periplasmic divalent cation tolerance protein
MNRLIVVYITCKGKEEAEKIGNQLMKLRLAPCYNVIPGMTSSCFWPPKTGEIERANEVVLLVKTVESKFTAIEKEVEKLHSDNVPCIFALPITHVSKKYNAWLQEELQ